MAKMWRCSHGASARFFVSWAEVSHRSLPWGFLSAMVRMRSRPSPGSPGRWCACRERSLLACREGQRSSMTVTPKRTYEIRLMGRVVSRRDDIDPQLAVLDYLREMGCEDEDDIRIGNDSVSWRGALYTAVPVSETDT